ncbi:MAG: hypothetical protein GY859_40350 [Desulfobacterales bacterium]|nr:hypothetical protein [Desulfobacterales bacterium]
MVMQRHVIEKQILELKLNSREDAFQIQNAVGALFRREVVPLIEAYCNQYSHADVIHRIDRLEIDIGKIDIRDLEKEFVEKVGSRLQEGLRKKIGKTDFTPGPPAPIRPTRTRTASNLELIAHFIRNGSLPWWAEKFNGRKLEKILARALDASPEAAKRLMIESVRNERWLKRLIYQFSDDVLLQITRLLSPGAHPFVRDYVRELKEILKKSHHVEAAAESLIRLETWRRMLPMLSAGAGGREAPRFADDTVRGLFESLGIQYPNLSPGGSRAARTHAASRSRHKTGLPEAPPTLHDIDETAPSEPGRSPEAVRAPMRAHSAEAESPPLSGRPPHPRGKSPGPGPDRAASRAMEKYDDPFNHADELYIGNAGLVLLWPFLPRFFKNLGLIEDKRFIDREARERAALLLQHATDGAEEIPEHLLLLNKILCGVNMAHPLEKDLHITANERAECENLLRAVIENWPILKNMSTPGFQQTFLQREGALSLRGGGWLLRVEQKTHDVLLDKLPWTIHVVKLKWMDDILYVEW